MRRMMKMAVVGGALLLGGVASAQQPPAQPGGTAGGTMPCCQGQGMQGGRMMGQGMGCRMASQANVTVQNTPDGSIIRLTAKDKSQVAAAQQDAQMLSRCMGGSAPR